MNRAQDQGVQSSQNLPPLEAPTEPIRIPAELQTNLLRRLQFPAVLMFLLVCLLYIYPAADDQAFLSSIHFNPNQASRVDFLGNPDNNNKLGVSTSKLSIHLHQSFPNLIFLYLRKASVLILVFGCVGYLTVLFSRPSKVLKISSRKTVWVSKYPKEFDDARADINLNLAIVKIIYMICLALCCSGFLSELIMSYWNSNPTSTPLLFFNPVPIQFTQFFVSINTVSDLACPLYSFQKSSWDYSKNSLCESPYATSRQNIQIKPMQSAANVSLWFFNSKSVIQDLDKYRDKSLAPLFPHQVLNLSGYEKISLTQLGLIYYYQALEAYFGCSASIENKDYKYTSLLKNKYAVTERCWDMFANSNSYNGGLQLLSCFLFLLIFFCVIFLLWISKKSTKFWCKGCCCQQVEVGQVNVQNSWGQIFGE